MHPNAKFIFQRYAAPHILSTDNVLEVGPDKPDSTFRELLGHERTMWKTTDINPQVRAQFLMHSEYDVPHCFENHFDVVFSANVIEHVIEPARWLRTLTSCVRPGGKLITINPVSWPYHEAPVDCWRIYPEGMRMLYSQAGLVVDFSTVACLEDVGAGTRVPGRSLCWVTEPELLTAYDRAMKEGGPVEAAFDVVTVGVRPTV